MGAVLAGFLFVIFSLLIALILIFLIVHGARKRNKKLVVACSIFLVVGFYCFFAVITPDIPYDTEWVRGKTADEIIKRYGEPDHNYHDEFEYDVNIPFSGYDDYYHIKFDENGLAYDIFICGPKGG